MMQTIIETPEFRRCAKALKVTPNELVEIINFIADNPSAGDEMAGTGGARKVRFSRPGTGKSGGYRVITFYSGKDIPVFLLSMFAKNQKINLSQAERNSLRQILKDLAEQYRRRGN